MTHRPLILAVLFLIQPPTSALPAQVPVRGTIYERITHERWMNGHQAPAFTRWGGSDHVIRFDSTSKGANGRQIWLHYDGGYGDNRPMIVASLDLASRLRSTATSLEATTEDVTDYGALLLPGTAAWDLLPSFHPVRMVPGAKWIDTVALESRAGPHHQSIKGIRTSRLIRDSLVAGRHYWLVRDTLRAHYAEVQSQHERTLSADVTIERLVSGAIVATSLIDPVSRTLLSRSDTVHMGGTATLRYPDGRRFATPTTFESYRRVLVFDSAGFRAMVDARLAASPRRFDMIRTPKGPLEEGLYAGSRFLRDSLLHRLDRSRDVDERMGIFQRLSEWNRKDYAATMDSVRTIQLRNGDTAFVIERWLDPADSPLTVERLRLLLPFARDPGLAFAWGVEIGEFYENVEQRMTEFPPAATSTPKDCWPCTLDGCKMLMEEFYAAKEPRLRRAALVTAFVVDPMRWIDTVRRDTSLAFLGRLYDDGTASKRPIPPVGGGWQSWVGWASGKPIAIDTVLPHDEPPRLSAREAPPFFELFSGRSLGREWQASLEKATQPGEHLVFETLLSGLGAWHPDPDSVAAWLLGTTKIGLVRGQRAAPIVVRASTVPPDSSTITELIDRLIAQTILGEKAWLIVRETGPLGRDPGHLGASAHVYVKTPVVTEALRAKWGDKVTWITDMNWVQIHNQNPGALIAITNIRRNGLFAGITIDRAMSGDEYFLMLTPDGWRVVSISGWVV